MAMACHGTSPPPPPQNIEPPQLMAENWCYTHLNIVKFSYTWIIDNFSHSGEVFKSSPFSSGVDDNSKWYLRLHPNGLDEESNEYISLYVLLVSCKKSEVKAKFKFSILNARCEKTNVMESQRAYRFVQGNEWGFRKFIRRSLLLDKANGLLHENQLILYCEVTVVGDSINLSGQYCATKIKVPDCSLSEDTNELFKSNKFSDVIFIVNGKEFFAHKAILAGRSAFFAAMFNPDMEEKKQNRVIIPDMDPTVFKDMLLFIYTGKAPPHLYESASTFIKAADKYALPRLRRLCEQKMYENLSVSSVCDIVDVADTYNCRQLKESAIDFIVLHASEIIDRDSWDSLIERKSHLLPEIYKASINLQVAPLMCFPRKRARNSNAH